MDGAPQREQTTTLDVGLRMKRCFHGVRGPPLSSTQAFGGNDKNEDKEAVLSRRKSYATHEEKILRQTNSHDCYVDDYRHWGRSWRLSVIPGTCRNSNRRTPTKWATHYADSHGGGNLPFAESGSTYTPQLHCWPSRGDSHQPRRQYTPYPDEWVQPQR